MTTRKDEQVAQGSWESQAAPSIVIDSEKGVKHEKPRAKEEGQDAPASNWPYSK